MKFMIIVTFKHRSKFPACEGPVGWELTETELHVKQGNPHERQHDNVRNEERSTTISIA